MAVLLFDARPVPPRARPRCLAARAPRPRRRRRRRASPPPPPIHAPTVARMTDRCRGSSRRPATRSPSRTRESRGGQGPSDVTDTAVDDEADHNARDRAPIVSTSPQYPNSARHPRRLRARFHAGRRWPPRRGRARLSPGVQTTGTAGATSSTPVHTGRTAIARRRTTPVSPSVAEPSSSNDAAVY